MTSSKVFVGFSESDRPYFLQLQEWMEGRDLGLCVEAGLCASADAAENEAGFRQQCRERMRPGDAFVVLIGERTRRNPRLDSEARAALEMGCTLIGVNLDGGSRMDPSTCPEVLRNAGLLFVPFIPRVVAFAVQDYVMADSGDWHYGEEGFRWMHPRTRHAGHRDAASGYSANLAA